MSNEGGISKREFLKLVIGLGVGTVATGVATYIYSEQKITSDRAAVDAVLKKNLQATAQTMLDRGEQTSFKPEGRFTQELFDKVRKSTFLAYLKTSSPTFAGTCWCAHKEGNSVYLVANRHAVYLPGNYLLRSIEIWRPNIDKQKISPLKMVATVSESRDSAIIKCELTPEQANSIKPLQYVDNADFKKDDKFLIVGVPNEFREAVPNDINALLSGEYTTILRDGVDSEYRLFGTGLEDGGGSGSVVVKRGDNGNPVAVANVYGKTIQANPNIKEGPKWDSIIACSSLDIAELITAVDKL